MLTRCSCLFTVAMPVWVNAVLNFGLVRTPFAGRLQLVVVWITTETALHTCKARLARNDAAYMAPSPACCTSKDVNELDQTGHCMVRHGWERVWAFQVGERKDSRHVGTALLVCLILLIGTNHELRGSPRPQMRLREVSMSVRAVKSGFVWSEAASCHGGRRA